MAAELMTNVRSMAIWNMNRYVVVPIVLIILGHWSLILQGNALATVSIDTVC